MCTRLCAMAARFNRQNLYSYAMPIYNSTNIYFNFLDVGCEIPGIPSPNLIANPLLQVRIYTVGETIAFSCLQGYEVVGDAQLTCLTGGGWSGVIPYCRCKFI